MKKGFRTIAQRAAVEHVIKKSRFIGAAYPVQTVDEALVHLEAVRKQSWDASHQCYAYIIGENSEQKRFSDDGEPQGTAGMPMLDVLQKKDLTNVLVIVTRYFGGTLLGAGGLVRAYAGAAGAAVDAAGISVMTPAQRIGWACRTCWCKQRILPLMFAAQSWYRQPTPKTFRPNCGIYVTVKWKLACWARNWLLGLRQVEHKN